MANSSLHDSAYFSLDQRSDQATKPMSLSQQNRQGQTFGDGFFFFDIEVDRAMEARFDEIDEELSARLFDHFRKALTKKPGLKPLTLALRVIGTTESNASTRLVLYCPPKYYKLASKFFKTLDAKELCESKDRTLPRLEGFVIPCTQKAISEKLDIDVCASQAITSAQSTLCGIPIQFINTSQESSSGAIRRSTLGGVIKVVHKNGDLSLYGLMAGHGVEECQSALSDQSTAQIDDNENSDESDDDSDDEGPSWPPLEEFEQQSIDLKDSNQAWNFSDGNLLGQVIDSTRLLPPTPSNKIPSHDWALVDLESPKPNELCATDQYGVLQRHPLLVASRPSFNDGLSDPVTLISGSHGPRIGELSRHPTRILIGSSEKFVKAFILSLKEGTGKTKKHGAEHKFDG
jgi:hypothetical protein